MAVEEVELKGNVHVQSGRSNGDNGLLAGSKELRQRNQLEVRPGRLVDYDNG
jgi:choline transport protein